MLEVTVMVFVNLGPLVVASKESSLGERVIVGTAVVLGVVLTM